MDSTKQNHHLLLKTAQLYHSLNEKDYSLKLANIILKKVKLLTKKEKDFALDNDGRRLSIMEAENIMEEEETETARLRRSFHDGHPSLKIVNRIIKEKGIINHPIPVDSSNLVSARNDEYPRSEIVSRILKKEGDINHQIPIDSSLSFIDPDLANGTALHIAAFKNDIDLFDVLLSHGANITIQNQNGNTILHYIIENMKQNINFINSIFSAHIESKVSVNPRNSKGISHFHIACLFGNMEAVDFFLTNNVCVDEATNFDCNDLSGWTPLHIATAFPRMKLLQLLLKYKANVHIRDAAGMTPLHVLVEQKIDRLDAVNANRRNNNTKFIEIIEDMVKLLLDSCDIDEMFSNDNNIALTHFQVACTMQDSSLAECLIDQIENLDHQIKIDSPVWPGYTALHFAAHCNIKIVKMLIDKGVNVDVKDAKGVKPLDICLQDLTLEKALSVIQIKESWKSVSFMNGRMKLFDFISAIKNPQTFTKYVNDTGKDLNTSLPREFMLWPGFTPLHLAVLLCADKDVELIRICLNDGADVTAQDCRGRTPIILAFRLNKPEIVNLLLLSQNVHGNPYDDEGLSHLHIVCGMNKLKLTKGNCYKKAKIVENINVAYKGQTSLGLVKPGSTPLHVAIANSSVDMVEMLIDHHADFSTKDANGLTPIDWFLYNYPNFSPGWQMKFRLLFNRELNRNSNNDDGLTWLHVASFFNYEKTVKKLLHQKVKVDPQISCKYPSNFWSQYVGCTPLHLTILRSSPSKKSPSKSLSYEIPSEICDELIANGADILSMRPNGMTPLYDVLIGNSDEDVEKRILTKLYDDDDSVRRLKEMSSITILHVASHCLDESATAKSFKEKVDVDARVNDDCKIWPGCTALHLVVNKLGTVEQDKTDYHLALLLDSGADVTIKNAEGDTPIHLVLGQESYNRNHLDVINKMLKKQKDFSLNPVGSRGISHFHAACIVNNVEATEQFIKHGVDVNKPVDLFAPKFAGESPLHLAINFESESEPLLQTVDLLLENGANVSTEDSFGNTVFHKVVEMRLTRMQLLERLASRALDVYSENIFGKTPLEAVLKMRKIPIDVLKFLVSRGCRINAYHPASEENYIKFIVSDKYHDNLQTEIFFETLNLTEVDERGRSVLHQIVAIDETCITYYTYVKLIEKFEKLGVDVDSQDKSGLTPLHLATMFRNITAIAALLNSSAEIDIVDSNGKTSLVLASELYSRDRSYEEVVVKLTRHVKKLEALDLRVSSINRTAIEKFPNRIIFLASNNLIRYRLRKELKISKSIVIESKSNLVLRDLVSDSGPMFNYPFMPESRVSRINEALKSSLKDGRRDGLKVFLNLQYRKAIARIPLAESAFMGVAFLFWLEHLWVPGECAINIIEHLSNTDMKNFLAAIDQSDEKIQSRFERDFYLDRCA